MCKKILVLHIAECAREFNSPLSTTPTCSKNVLYSGVWTKYAYTKRKEEKAMMDPYRVLGVSPNASEEEIKKAYKQLARKYPSGSEQRFQGSRGQIRGNQRGLFAGDETAHKAGAARMAALPTAVPPMAEAVLPTAAMAAIAAPTAAMAVPAAAPMAAGAIWKPCATYIPPANIMRR